MEASIKSIVILYIPHLILKFYLSMPFIYQQFPLQRSKWYPVYQEQRKDNEFEYYFLIICRYLNHVKNQRIILLQIINCCY
jgi:hypothetical protein